MATVEVIPFSPGRRPTDEARHPGMGSSDAVAFLEGDCYLLLAVRDAAGCTLEVDARRLAARPRPGSSTPTASCTTPTWTEDRTYVLTLRDLPGEYSFATLFSQRLDVGVRLVRDGAPVAETRTPLEVYDVAQMGSLYERIVTQLVVPDTERQVPGLSHAYHPWFPVLLIGAHKAELYTRALVGDIVHKRNNLADPGWLVRVGLYLEFLTALGIIEGVDPSVLTPRSARRSRPARRSSRSGAASTPGAWAKVWELREIAVRGRPRTGPVAVQNLLAKRRATLQFLHVHHEDLQQAIALAGPNPQSAQETWHRVFRDAERAVLRQTPDAFPELADLPVEVRKFVLWHRRGKLGAARPGAAAEAARRPGRPVRRGLQPVPGLDEPGRRVGAPQALMDYTGEEAIPRGVSLFEAHLYQPSRVALLQRRDGYDADRIEVGAELPEGHEPPLRVLADLLAGHVAVHDPARGRDRAARRPARPLTFGPMERIIVQGQEGDSLFAVVEGDGRGLPAPRGRHRRRPRPRTNGTVLGEMSLLTGAPRSATVRAVDGALVYEVGRRQLDPILAARPELVDALQEAMATRLRTQGEALERYDAARPVPAVAGEELQGVGPGGVRAEGLDVLARRRRELLGLRERDAVLRRQDHGGGERGEREVGGGEAVAAEVAAPVGEALRDRVEDLVHAAPVVVGVLDRELAPGPAGGEAEAARERLGLPGRDALVVERQHHVRVAEHVRVDQAPAVGAERGVEVA